MNKVLAYMEKNKHAIVEDLKTVVSLESPSFDKAAVDRLGRRLEQMFAETGAATAFLPQENYGDLLRIEWGEGMEDGQTLVLCHMDTVFGIGDIAKNPLRMDNGRLYGPGSYDMKAGIVLFLWALRCMKDLNLKPRRTIVGLVTSDEEIGSLASRPVIEHEARRSKAALVTEPPMSPSGALKTWRKGMAMYELFVTGKSAHAGSDPGKGVSAVEELAHQILALRKLEDQAAGTTVNIGVISGGTRSNVVAAEAYAQIDVRFRTMEEAQRVDAAIRGLAPVLPGAGLRVEGGINRPPMMRNEKTAALFEKARALAAELGFELTEAGTGGGSDGNFTSHVGCPTLDGLGACGDGMHTFDEYVDLESLPQRAAFMVRLLQEV